MHDARTRHHEAGARPARQVAYGAGGIGGRLLIAAAIEFDAGLLRLARDRLHRKTDDAEHVIDALIFQGARHDRGTC